MNEGLRHAELASELIKSAIHLLRSKMLRIPIKGRGWMRSHSVVFPFGHIIGAAFTGVKPYAAVVS
jgi:hypothetical protein